MVLYTAAKYNVRAAKYVSLRPNGRYVFSTKILTLLLKCVCIIFLYYNFYICVHRFRVFFSVIACCDGKPYTYSCPFAQVLGKIHSNYTIEVVYLRCLYIFQIAITFLVMCCSYPQRPLFLLGTVIGVITMMIIFDTFIICF
jgi:hypothetical protein